MKKLTYILIMGTLSLSMLVGCMGADSEVEEATVVGTVDVYLFPDNIKANGYTIKTIEDISGDWSLNDTYAKMADESVMTFTWKGTKECAKEVFENEGTVFLTDEDESVVLTAWAGEWTANDYEDIKAMSKSNIVANNLTYTYPIGGFYVMEISDTRLRITFEINNAETKERGYACYIIDDTYEIVYQFNYVEVYDTYDDMRALTVINSIEYAELPEEPGIN